MVFVDQNEDSSARTLGYTRVYARKGAFGYTDKKKFADFHFRSKGYNATPPVLWMLADSPEEIEDKILEQFPSVQAFINAFSSPVPKVYNKDSVVIFNKKIPFKSS